MVKLKRDMFGWVYITPNKIEIHINRNDNVSPGYWERYKVGMGTKAKYFDTLKEVRQYLRVKYEHGVKPGNTLYMTNNIEVGYVVREVLPNGEFICDEYRTDDDYEFRPTGDTSSVFWSDDYWIAPPQSRLS